MFQYLKRWFPARDELSKPKAAAGQAIEMLRREYSGKPLIKSDVHPDPIRQFSVWFDEAVEAVKADPNAVLLSTVSKMGKPSCRTVLLKGFNDMGFIFYTNYKSRKAHHIESQPSVALTFYWPELMRQIHIEGSAEKVSAEKSDAYFKTRPPSSKRSAWASMQSDVVDSREQLEKQLKDVEKEYTGDEIPRPPHWGGYRVKPERIEFWQGRLNRLHDRICYTHRKDGEWVIERLSP
jgi:pyridoxamine 5'-phosphate oxidase